MMLYTSYKFMQCRQSPRWSGKVRVDLKQKLSRQNPGQQIYPSSWSAGQQIYTLQADQLYFFCTSLINHLNYCEFIMFQFIGELGKLDILAESILHRCVQQLLGTNRFKPMSEDLECLCQIMKTCGRILDTEKGSVSIVLFN